ncbi:MAG: hypothetical protein AAF467_00135 [Actinomycetota bacterium]
MDGQIAQTSPVPPPPPVGQQPIPAAFAWTVPPVALGAAFVVTVFAGLAGVLFALSIWFIAVALWLIPAASVTFALLVGHQKPGALHPALSVGGLALTEIGVWFWLASFDGGTWLDALRYWPPFVPGIVTGLVAIWVALVTRRTVLTPRIGQ